MTWKLLVLLLALRLDSQAASISCPNDGVLIPENLPVNCSGPAAQILENPSHSLQCSQPLPASTFAGAQRSAESRPNQNEDATSSGSGGMGLPSIIQSPSFQDYLQQFKPQKLPTSKRLLQEFDFRRFVFLKQVKAIYDHNANNPGSYVMGLNQFTDWTDEEIKRLFSGFQSLRRKSVLNQQLKTRRQLSIQPLIENQNPCLSQPALRNYTEPENLSIDWRCLGNLPVYKFGKCGASPFFSTVDALHMTTKYWGYDFPPFSFQAAISCFAKSSQNVCLNGANYIDAYDYVRKYGIGPADAYPYTDQNSPIHASKCDYQKLKSPSYRKKLLFIKQIYLIEANDCREVVEQLKSRALTVGIIANINFVKYESGTFEYDPQTEETANHAVVLAGYDPDKGYLIKNAWGEGWGMKGYAYVTKESGVCEWAVYAKGFYQLKN